MARKVRGIRYAETQREQQVLLPIAEVGTGVSGGSGISHSAIVIWVCVLFRQLSVAGPGNPDPEGNSDKSDFFMRSVAVVYKHLYVVVFT